MTTASAATTLFKNVCVECQEQLNGSYQPFCACGGHIDPVYDLETATLHDSPNPYTRFRDLLPVRDATLLPLNAAYTPTVHARNLGGAIGLPWLYLKDETTLPTGTTKDRMAEIALAYLWEAGVRDFCSSSTGNSSTAFAHAISRFPGMTMFLFTAADFRDRVNEAATDQVVSFILRDATFVEAFDAARIFAQKHGVVSERGFFNPGRREGLKLAFMEATDQVPCIINWYVQAVSSAMGVYGTWNAARQLHGIGHIADTPRLLCVQQETCSPMVSAWRDGAEAIQPEHIVKRPVGIAKAILRGDPTKTYPLIRAIVRESSGDMCAVSEKEIREAQQMVIEHEGIRPCFSASAAVAGLMRSARNGLIDPDETVLVNLTGSDRTPESGAGIEHWLRRTDDGWEPDDANDAATAHLWAHARRIAS